MEALWTRFLPALVDLQARLEEGAIGELRLVEADFGFRAQPDPESRLFSRELGGGALLDIGIYPLNLAFMLCGAPTAIQSTANLGSTGVDEEAAMLLRHARGQLSLLHCSFRADTPRQALLVGTEGSITIEAPWWCATRYSVRWPDGSEEAFEFVHRGGGYSHQAEAFMETIRAGRLESDVMPLAESLSILETMDEMRTEWGVKYFCD